MPRAEGVEGPDSVGAPILVGGHPLLSRQERYELVDGEWMRWHVPGSRFVRASTEDLGFIEAIEAMRRELAKAPADAGGLFRGAEQGGGFDAEGAGESFDSLAPDASGCPRL